MVESEPFTIKEMSFIPESLWSYGYVKLIIAIFIFECFENFSFWSYFGKTLWWSNFPNNVEKSIKVDWKHKTAKFN